MFDGKTTFPSPSNINTAAGQHIPRLKVPECIMEGKFQWSGKGFCGGDIQHQFHQYEYPAPGYSKIKMLWKYGGPWMGTMTATNRYAKMYTHPGLEFVVSQSIWFEGEVQFADLILPACTNFERWDISEFANCSGYIPDNYQLCNHRVISLQAKCIEPVGESLSDYEIYAKIAKKLNIWEMFTEGKDELAWVEQYYNATDMPKHMTFAEFKDKGYFVVPDNPGRKKTVALRWFAEDREKDTPDWGPRLNNQVNRKGLQTSTGKVEFISTSIQNFEEQGYVDEYRPAMHTYVPAWESWHCELAKKYPLGMLSPHPRFSMHTMGDGKDSFMNDIKDHRVLLDGHYYWIMRMNSVDAAARGIKEGDLIRAFNDRGSVILCAQVGERLQPGTVHSYESCAEYNPLGTPGKSADRGGCVNILSPDRYMSKYACGMAPNTTQLEVEKWDGGVYETE
jgi:anaerobic selenocysteine-containing dehydrogenase